MNSNKYVAINTKLKGMESRFLNQKDYENLLACDSISSLTGYLKNTQCYGDILNGVNTDTVTRGSLEKILDNALIEDIDRMKNYLSSDEKKFIHCLYAKYEISDMKRYARKLYGNTSYLSEDQTEEYAFLGKFSKLKRESFLHCKTLKDLVYCYENTPFFKYLKPMLEYDERMDPFRFETLLDLAYYTIIIKEAKNLTKGDRFLIEDAVGTIADLYNLQWIIRAKCFFSMHPAVIFNYTISFTKRINKRKLKDFCYMQNTEKLFKQIRQTPYAFLISESAQPVDAYMRNRLKNYIYRYLLKLKRDNGSSIIASFAHIVFLQYQTEDITTLIEATKYDLSIDEAKKYLIKYN